MKTKKIIGLIAAASIILLTSGQANAWHASGKVVCDVNQSGSIDAGDLPLSDFGYGPTGVNMINSGGDVFYAITTAEGSFWKKLPDLTDDYTMSLDISTLPADATTIQPPGGVYAFQLTDSVLDVTRNFLVDSEVCHPQIVEDKCWLTGGGVKFSHITDTYVAEHGPRDNLGGNVFPSCDPDPGNGGQWNHVAHSAKLHFLGTDINTVRCGNVPGIESGSESPVTPYNYIEFQGTGRLTGIKGNKVNHGNVHFFARAEDRNEPGSRGAKDGVDIDRYYIHVFSDPADPAGTTLMLLDDDGQPSTVDPVTITGGNLQLHISSCDNPPAQ